MPIRLPRWTPAVVFAALAFTHALALPTFEGMDEPAHLSSILQFAAGHGRPVPSRARLHQSVERAVGLVPGPYHQWEDGRTKLGGVSYSGWRGLTAEERAQRKRVFAALRTDQWSDGQLENWQAQHPPLYYAVVGQIVHATGASRLVSAHRVARMASAAIFATTGIVLTAFITGPWGASPLAALFVALFPMWYVMGARISNDALAIPALGLALLIAIDQMRRPVSEWRPFAWILAGMAAAVGIAAKAYGLVFLPVAAVASTVAFLQRPDGPVPWHRRLWPVAAIAIAVSVNLWWLADNEARGAGITGQNENVSLAARGIVGVSDRLPYATDLVFNKPSQLASAVTRAAAQSLYVSNWTFGAAPWWFYLLQVVAWGLLVTRHAAPMPPLRRTALLVAGIALATMSIGMAKAVLDFYILFGETRLAQGWYVWGVGAAFSAVLALAFDASPPWRRRTALLLQVVCLITALVTDTMFWSGRYERDPILRTPTRVSDSKP